MSALDSVGVFLGVVQSGLVTSGNAFMTCTRVVTSGDALTSFQVSGPNDFIGVRLAPGRGNPLTGGFTEINDTIVCDIYHHDTSQVMVGIRSGASAASVQRMVSDFKVTVASGAWAGTGIPPPKLIGETHPLAQAMFARATLTYRVRYLNP